MTHEACTINTSIVGLFMLPKPARNRFPQILEDAVPLQWQLCDYSEHAKDWQ